METISDSVNFKKILSEIPTDIKGIKEEDRKTFFTQYDAYI